MTISMSRWFLLFMKHVYIKVHVAPVDRSPQMRLSYCDVINLRDSENTSVVNFISARGGGGKFADNFS